MFNCIKAVLAAGILLSSAGAFAQSIPTCPIPSGTLTASQCTKLRADLAQYIIYVNAWLASLSPAKQILYKPYVVAAIAEAKKLVDKKCPQAPAVRFECIVRDQTTILNTSLGVDAVGALTNNTTLIASPVCVSQNACLSIVSSKFIVAGTLQSVRCNPPDGTVTPLTDAEVQTKTNAIP